MCDNEYCLVPGTYCIGDPEIMLNRVVYDSFVIDSGMHIYNGCISIINETGFQEGIFKDVESTEYTITSGYIGIFPFPLCSNKSIDILSKYGKCINLFVPFFVRTSENGCFSIQTSEYQLLLDTSLENFEEMDLI